MSPIKVSALPLLVLLMSSGASATMIAPLGFPDLPGLSGERSSVAQGISADGSVVVGYAGAVWPGQASPFTQERAFRWTETGGFEVLPGETAQQVTVAWGVSADGGTVVGSRGFNSSPLVWSGPAPSAPLTESPTPNGRALSASADGSVIVLETSLAGSLGVLRWMPGSAPMTLGPTPEGVTIAQIRGGFISADGSAIAGGLEFGGGLEAFRWTSDGGIAVLGDLPGGERFSEASGISADGATLVGIATDANGRQAMKWDEAAGMVGLGNLPGSTSCSGKAVANGGGVIVGSCDSAAFIWTAEGGMESLLEFLIARAAPGTDHWLNLRSATGISPDGQWIVGYGQNADFQTEAFRINLTPIPLPSAVWLMLSALVVLSGIRRRG